MCQGCVRSVLGVCQECVRGVGNIYKNAQDIHKKITKNKESQNSEIISEIPVGDQNKQSQ